MTDFGSTLPRVTELAPDVHRVVAPNPSMMTGPGTNTYIFGEREIAVLDPGPVSEPHLQQILDVAGTKIRWVIATHTHKDHSPLCFALAKVTGAEILGIPAPDGVHQDKTFAPDRILRDGDRINVEGIDIEAVHTPGHASNHLCFHHRKLNWVFTGDHVIDGSTVVIDPPDGSMSDYLASLRRLRAMKVKAIAPGHGDLIRKPNAVIDWIIEHRLEREAKVLAAVAANPGSTTRALVPVVYKDVDKRLYGFAERSLLAHLEKLDIDQAIERNVDSWSPLDA